MRTTVVMSGDIHGQEVFKELDKPKRLWKTNDEWQLVARIEPSGWSFLVKQNGHELNATEIATLYARRLVPPTSQQKLPQHAEEFSSRETQEVFAALVGLCRYQTHSAVISHGKQLDTSSNKVLQLAVARDIGLEVPKTLVTNIPGIASNFYQDCKGTIIYKCLSTPVVEYEDGKRSMIYTSEITSDDFSNVQHCPCLFQENLEKDHELRVAIVGNKSIVVRVDSQDHEETSQDWRKNMAASMYSKGQLPDSIVEKLATLNNTLGVAWSMVDIVVTKNGEYVFLEANPDGAWLWLEESLSDLNITKAICEAILDASS